MSGVQPRVIYVTNTGLPEWANVIAVFDTETTGIAPETTRIVSAHVSVLNPYGEVEDPTNWLIDCGIDIPEQATAVHGITTERMRAEGAPAADSIYEILTKIQGFLSAGIGVVAYNAAYDFTILDREAKRYGFDPLDVPAPIIDPLIIDKQVDKYRKGKRTLEAAAAHYGVALTDAHDASADAIAAGRVAQAIGKKYAADLAYPARELHDLQVTWAKEQAESYATWRRSQNLPVYPGDGLWPVR
ncbi:DNA polymerase-3 subunit epsilon [Aurantimicrobium minutum]|jgi:DNA polymerase-3 subunit epsilon|uniref:DNA polymerase III PolC-type n=1 Tax=Aurantimicrobium photophilum TaxID=1987356 RepID=A0A2Z3RY97_9MICO|nr:DNA polymerase III PolC-type [Aurantimicrobium photophilum]MDF9810081.1 DNA polymerase-3 subunit epsilon [Aurantimicrobium minutum]